MVESISLTIKESFLEREDEILTRGTDGGKEIEERGIFSHTS